MCFKSCSYYSYSKMIPVDKYCNSKTKAINQEKFVQVVNPTDLFFLFLEVKIQNVLWHVSRHAATYKKRISARLLPSSWYFLIKGDF